MNIQVADRTDAARVATVDSVDVAPIIGAWLTADDHHAHPALYVRELDRALRAGDWARVHALADYLSFDVAVVA